MSSHQHPRKRGPFSRLLSLIVPNRVRCRAHRVSSPNKCCVPINTLPDEVLLHIFHFVRVTSLNQFPPIDPVSPLYQLAYFDRVTFLDQEFLGSLDDFDHARSLSWWHELVHVCQKWRYVVFGSPIFLDLRIVCGPRTRGELIGIWPYLPIILASTRGLPGDYNFDSAIVHPNRVCEIDLIGLTGSQLQRLASAMQERFPALIRLMLDFSAYYPRPAPILPDGFLGGSAPGLQSLRLHSIPFPALPKLLLSATDLVYLNLWDIPHSGYISPEAIVPGLVVLANLKSLTIGFNSPLSRPDRESRRPPPPARAILPALTRFQFSGVSEYLEDLVARIDAPFLDQIWINFFHQLIFDIPQLAQFMRRTTRFQAPNEAHVVFHMFGVLVGCLSPTGDNQSWLKISCRALDWQLSSAAQVFTLFFPSIHMMEQLYIHGKFPLTLRSRWQDDMENMQWLEIFHPFTAVKNLYVCKEFAQCIASALQDPVVERVTDVLPALESLFLEGLEPSGAIQEAIEQFVAARQILGHPVAVSHWNGRGPPQSIANGIRLGDSFLVKL